MWAVVVQLHPISPTQNISRPIKKTPGPSSLTPCSSQVPTPTTPPADRRRHCRGTWTRPRTNFVRSPQKRPEGARVAASEETQKRVTGRDYYCVSPHFTLTRHIPARSPSTSTSLSAEPSSRSGVTNDSPSPTLPSNPVVFLATTLHHSRFLVEDAFGCGRRRYLFHSHSHSHSRLDRGLSISHQPSGPRPSAHQ
jgi:hypothetical protein